MMVTIVNRFRLPKESDYILAYLLKGSVASLNRYINAHPRGKDAGRRDIITIKYALSNCSTLVRSLILKMYKEMDSFNVSTDNMLGNEYLEYQVHDTKTQYKFQCFINDKKHVIELSDGTKISDLLVDYKLFMMAAMGIIYIEDNIQKFEKEREEQKTKLKVMAAYT